MAVDVARIGTVVTAKVVDVEPAGTVTEAGTVTVDKFEVRVTTAPPAGAGPVKVTVPVEFAPPATLVGDTLIVDSFAAATIRVLVFVVDPNVAEMVTVSFDACALVAILNVAVVLPAGTVTEAGSVTSEALELSAMTAPPEGATPVSVTVPTEGEPPIRELGANESVCNWKACRPRTPV